MVQVSKMIHTFKMLKMKMRLTVTKLQDFRYDDDELMKGTSVWYP